MPNVTEPTSAATAVAEAVDATYLELIDLALKFPVGDYRDGIVRAAQHVAAKANTCYQEAARV